MIFILGFATGSLFTLAGVVMGFWLGRMSRPKPRKPIITPYGYAEDA